MTTNRFGVTILDPHECWEQLRHADVGRVAISVRDHPSIFPINFVIDREAIVLRTAAGTKLTTSTAGDAGGGRAATVSR